MTVVLGLLGSLLVLAMAVAWVSWDSHGRAPARRVYEPPTQSDAGDVELADYEEMVRRLRELERDADRRLRQLRDQG